MDGGLADIRRHFLVPGSSPTAAKNGKIVIGSFGSLLARVPERAHTMKTGNNNRIIIHVSAAAQESPTTF